MKEKDKILNVPNILSILRILMVGVLIYLFIFSKPIWALIVYILASLTDFLDGYIARKFNMITPLGKLLDPFADKLMLVTALICLYTKNMIALSLLILVLVKEILLILGSFFLLKYRHIVVEAKIFGKITTVLFTLSIVLTFVHDYVQPVDTIILYCATILSLVALIQYTYINVMRKNPKS